jgi:NAD-dependent deacetylase
LKRRESLYTSTMKINFADYSRVVVLTGAGISVASGLRPYRGPGGIWNEADLERLAHADTLATAPDAVWQAFGPMRTAILAAQPNPVHTVLRDWEASLRPGQEMLVVTQNIDGLHLRAGTSSLTELHGNMLYTRCSNARCTQPRAYDEATHVEEVPRCPLCQSPLRPDVVFFGEYISGHDSWTVKRALRDCDLFLAIGTSGLVTPAADFVRGADYAGARTIYLNVEPMASPNRYFHEEIIGRAEEVLPRLLQLGS